jgi:hypothetical protein
MINNKFGYVSRAESDALGHLEKWLAKEKAKKKRLKEREMRKDGQKGNPQKN